MIPDYLLMPKNHQFSTKGFCGSTGTLNVYFYLQRWHINIFHIC
jgi:hypothetical protein